MKKHLYKTIIITLACSLALISLSACRNKDGVGPGFENGNIAQGGLLAKSGDWLYFRSEADSWSLYGAHADGSERRQLTDDIPASINIVGGWIYYLNFRDGFSIYRIKTDGSGREKIRDGYCSNLYVDGNTLYYDIRDETNMSHIYSCKSNGSNNKLILERAAVQGYYNNSIYYTNSAAIEGEAALSLYRYDLKKKSTTKLNNCHSAYVTVNEDGVYYWNADNNSFWRVDHDGNNAEVIAVNGDYYNVAAGYLYYQKYGNGYNFFRLDLQTKEEVQLTDFLTGMFDLEGKLIADPSKLTENDLAFSESGVFSHVFDGVLYLRCSLRESLLENGRLDCLAMIGPGGELTVFD